MTSVLLVLCCFFIPTKGSSQKFIPDYLKNRPVTILKEDTSFVFKITGKDVRNPNKKRMYHYLFHRELGQSRGSYLGNLVDGNFTCFIGKGRLLRQGEFKSGLKNGTWYTWHSNGEISSKTRWRKGKLVGKKIEYDLKGIESARYRWKDKKWQLIIPKDKEQVKNERKLKKEEKKTHRKAKSEERKLKRINKKESKEEIIPDSPEQPKQKKIRKNNSKKVKDDESKKD